ncbi:MAG: hydroxyacid dehydrogenase [Firmicutes bacterium]|nr:hydroxyacid dehydrogenase [Bacillota bacterium]
MSKSFRVLVMPTGELFNDLFPTQVIDRLSAFADIKRNTQPQLTKEQLLELTKDVDAIITSWGSPLIDEEVVLNSPKLKFIGHAAGSIRPIVTPDVFEHGVTVSSSAGIIAEFVGEACLLSALSGFRNLVENHRDMQEGNWRGADYHEHDSLIRQDVGLVGLGMTAREFLKLLAPFNCRVRAYDPFVSPGDATRLGVELTELDHLLAVSKVISLHAASLPETRHMIDERRLGLIQDGALLINTARGALIDEEALVRELSTNRFKAVLDVYEMEPLPPESPLRRMPNVVLTPHIAGPAYKRRWEMALGMVEDCEAILRGGKAKHAVDKGLLDRIA